MRAPSSLWFRQGCGQGAGTSRWSQGAESIQVIRQVRERNLEQIGAAQRGAEFVEHAVAAGDGDRTAINADIGTAWRGIVQQLDAPGRRSRDEVVSDDRGSGGTGDIQLGSVDGSEEVYGLQRALAKFDALRRVITIVALEGQSLGAERSGRRLRQDGGDDVETR